MWVGRPRRRQCLPAEQTFKFEELETPLLARAEKEEQEKMVPETQKGKEEELEEKEEKEKAPSPGWPARAPPRRGSAGARTV